MQRLVLLFLGGVAACSSPTSTPAPASATSAASGPAPVTPAPAPPASAASQGVDIAGAVAALDGARGPEIELRKLSGRVLLHDSVAERESFGRVHANGLIIVGSRGAVIVDSAWTPAQTRWLLDQVAGATGRPALALVATHFHDDRAGGAATARAAGVPVHASRRTAELLDDAGASISQPFETEATLSLGDLTAELFFPGPGHSRDNIVVYLREEKLLFGGCLIRAGESSWIGYVGDADVTAWPGTMDALIARYGGAVTVVPGHGKPGDASLLTHTRALATAAASQP